jgi:NADH:ubiquinone oxidoreductase subunit D
MPRLFSSRSSLKALVEPDEDLIISRLQEKELEEISVGSRRITEDLAHVNQITLQPIFDGLELKLALHLSVIGEKLIDCRVERGFVSQGIENLLAQTNFREGLKILERLSRALSLPYQLAYLIALEELFEIETPVFEQRNRAIALESARVLHHLDVLAKLLFSLNCDQEADLVKSTRTYLLGLNKLFKRVCTNFNEIEKSPSLAELMEACEIALTLISEAESLFISNHNIQAMLTKKAIISQPRAVSQGLDGLFLRANRMSFKDFDTYSGRISYRFPLEQRLLEGSDALTRSRLRFEEIRASLQWLLENFSLYAQEEISLFPIVMSEEITECRPRNCHAFGEIYGPEGMIKVSIFFKPASGQKKVVLRSPAYFIAQAIPRLFLGARLKDIPVILYSLGISTEEIDK